LVAPVELLPLGHALLYTEHLVAERDGRGHFVRRSRSSNLVRGDRHGDSLTQEFVDPTSAWPFGRGRMPARPTPVRAASNLLKYSYPPIQRGAEAAASEDFSPTRLSGRPESLRRIAATHIQT
jgi:hypothetical protein